MSNQYRTRSLAVFSVMLVASILAIVFAYRDITSVQNAPARTLSKANHIPTPTSTKATISPTPEIVVPQLAPVDTASVLGVDGKTQLAGVSWVRIEYSTCNSNGLDGTALQNAVTEGHTSGSGVHVLLLFCQGAISGAPVLTDQQLNDLTRAGADAVQCGDQQMKQNAQTTYMNPADFARFYDLCSSAVQKFQPNVPVLMGSLDPHIGGVDVAPLYDQLNYLNQMQTAMNSTIHPGGNWQWRAHAIGLIDSWHNGYPNQYTNSLSNLFVFWAQQFGVDVQSGDLGKHLWVVEGMGCFKDCGLDPTNAYQIAVSHVLTLITDVQTALRYKVPFFYFSAQDFTQDGVLWPLGILGPDGNPKPIRQDLPMGARALDMACPDGPAHVVDQEQLLVNLYRGCNLPSDYINTLNS